MKKETLTEIREQFDETAKIFVEKWIPSANHKLIFEKSVIKKINDKIGLEPTISILDMGCGHGTWIEYIIEKKYTLNLSIVGIDLSPERISIAKKIVGGNKNVQLIAGDILQYDDTQKFDIIFFNEVLCYIPQKDYKIILDKCFNLLKEGGHLIIIDKTKISKYAFNIYIKERLGMLGKAYRHINYPSFLFLTLLSKKSGFIVENKIKLAEFHCLILRKPS